MEKTIEYGNENISSLKGADMVRRRPGAIFGSDGQDGCRHTVFEILSNAVDEAREGHGNIINVTRYDDGSIEIEDFGRGYFVDWNQNAGRYNWEILFCELHTGGQYRNSVDANQGLGLNGVCATQYASEYMNVWISRDGYDYTLHFERGENIGGLMKKESSRNKTGSRIQWRLDREVFNDIDIPLEYFVDTLKRQAAANAGIKFRLRYERNGRMDTFDFHHESGVMNHAWESTGEGAIAAPRSRNAGRPDRTKKRVMPVEGNEKKKTGFFGWLASLVKTVGGGFKHSEQKQNRQLEKLSNDLCYSLLHDNLVAQKLKDTVPITYSAKTVNIGRLDRVGGKFVAPAQSADGERSLQSALDKDIEVYKNRAEFANSLLHEIGERDIKGREAEQKRYRADLIRRAEGFFDKLNKNNPLYLSRSRRFWEIDKPMEATCNFLVREYNAGSTNAIQKYAEAYFNGNQRQADSLFKLCKKHDYDNPNLGTMLRDMAFQSNVRISDTPVTPVTPAEPVVNRDAQKDAVVEDHPVTVKYLQGYSRSHVTMDEAPTDEAPTTERLRRAG